MSEARDVIAKIACDEAFRWGDRLNNWDNSAEDARGSFREEADVVIAALAADGYVIARMERTECGYDTHDDKVTCSQCGGRGFVYVNLDEPRLVPLRPDFGGEQP